MDKDFAARGDKVCVRPCGIFDIRIENMEFPLLDGVGIPAIYQVKPFGQAAVARSTLRTDWVEARQNPMCRPSSGAARKRGAESHGVIPKG